MSVDLKDYLFEVSWEICNQLGEVYSAIHSKIPSAARAFRDRYILLGPDLKDNLDFEETDEDFWSAIRENTAIKDLPCRFGRWKVPGEPKVIQVNFTKKYNKDQLLFQLWADYGIDSISGGWDYVERVMFGYACGEVIETIHNLKVKPKGLKAVAQFHDAVSGAGLLCVKKMVPEVGTVLTLHSTVLGRTLPSSGMDIYSEMDHISPQREAGAHNCTAQYSLEAACAREADCLTAVSDITALEAKNFLGRSPEVITPNGLDVESLPDLSRTARTVMASVAGLLVLLGVAAAWPLRAALGRVPDSVVECTGGARITAAIPAESVRVGSISYSRPTGATDRRYLVTGDLLMGGLDQDLLVHVVRGKASLHVPGAEKPLTDGNVYASGFGYFAGNLADRFTQQYFERAIGARLVAQGNFPLVIHCQGSADISGEIALSGSAGGNGLRGDNPAVSATGGAGGAGAPVAAPRTCRFLASGSSDVLASALQ